MNKKENIVDNNADILALIYHINVIKNERDKEREKEREKEIKSTGILEEDTSNIYSRDKYPLVTLLEKRKNKMKEKQMENKKD